MQTIANKTRIKVIRTIRGEDFWQLGTVGVTKPEWRKNDERGEHVWANADAAVLCADGTQTERRLARIAKENAAIVVNVNERFRIEGEGVFEAYRIDCRYSDFVWFRSVAS